MGYGPASWHTMPYSSSEEYPTLSVPVDVRSMMMDVDGPSLHLPHVPPNVGWRQVGRVADDAPVIGRQRGHHLCGHIRGQLRRYCITSGN